MSHAPIDVHIDEHPTNAWMTIEELGLHMLAIVYCNRNLTDGFVPETQIRKFGSCGRGPKVVRRLVERGRWTRGEQDGNEGYFIVGYLERNPSRAQVEERIAAKKAAGRVGGTRSGEARRTRPVEAPAEAPASSLVQPRDEPLLNPIQSTALQSTAEGEPPIGPPLAAPAPPEPTPRAGRGTRLPADWTPPADVLATLAGEGLDGARELPAFRDHWAAQPGAKGVKADWPATFRNWVRRSAEFRGNRGPRSSPDRAPDGRPWRQRPAPMSDAPPSGPRTIPPPNYDFSSPDPDDEPAPSGAATGARRDDRTVPATTPVTTPQTALFGAPRRIA